MAVIEAPPSSIADSIELDRAEQPLLLRDVSWQSYELIGAALRDRATVRLTYDRESLEIMTLSAEHEKLKRRIGRLLEILAEETGLSLEPGGSMTFKLEESGRGL